MRDVKLHNILIVLKCPFAEDVIVVIEPETPTQQVQTVKMMESLDICGVATAVLLVDFYLVVCETKLWGQRGGDDERAIVDAEGILPRLYRLLGLQIGGRCFL